MTYKADKDAVKALVDAACSRLAEGRKIAELGQEDLAALSGVPRSMISDFERGARVPSAEHVFRICLAAGLSPAWVMTGDGDPFHKKETPDSTKINRDALLKLPLDEVTRTYYLSLLDGLGNPLKTPMDVLAEAKSRATR